MDRGAWWATVHGVAKSQTRLSDFTYLLTYLQVILDQETPGLDHGLVVNILPCYPDGYTHTCHSNMWLKIFKNLGFVPVDDRSSSK